jgi:hypothetical protein
MENNKLRCYCQIIRQRNGHDLLPTTTEQRRHTMTAKIITTPLVALIVSLALVGSSMAAEVKLISTINAVQISAAGDSATVTLKDAAGKVVKVTVTDEVTLDKFKDKRIVEGDEVRVKYDDKDGKNVTKLLRKTAGC